MGAFRLVFNASALLAALALAWTLGVAALQAQPLPWQSLALGRLLAEAGSFPDAEALLFTASQRAFDGLSWGWDLLAALALRQGGEGLLRAADAAALGLAGLSLAAAAFRRGARPFSTGLFTAWALWAAQPDLQPGPALLAWALFCLALWLMEGPLDQALAERWIWLPPLALVAVNLHAAAWALAPLALLWLLFERGGPGFWPRAVLAGLLLLCLGLHPQGPWSQAWALGQLAPSPLWPGVFEQRQAGLLLLALALLLLLGSSWTPGGAAAQARDRAVLAAFGGLALFSRDALPWALAVAAPMAAGRLGQLLDALPPELRRLRWPLKAALLGLGVVLALRGAWRPVGALAPRPLPDKTLAFYEQELLNLRIACPPEWTPWLAQRLVPHAAFAVDARARAPRAVREAMDQALRLGGPGTATALEGLGAEAAWLPLGSPAAVALATAQGWQPVAVDNASVLYVRESPARRELVRVHAPRGLRLGDPGRPFDPSRLAQAEADLEMRLARDPQLGLLYLFLAELWLAKGHEAKARETLEAGIRADPASAWPYARLAGLRARRGESAEARLLYRKALARRDSPEWRQALAALEAR